MIDKSLPNLPEFRVDLIGKKVFRAERDADGIGLQFEGGWNIAIWTDCLFLCGGKEESQDNVRILEGTTLSTFSGNAEAETLYFDNGCQLVVDLVAASRSSFEAMAVYGPEHLIVVWE
jgi:hypothetical protein